MFPDIENVLCSLIVAKGLVAESRVGTATPSDLGSRLPFVRVIRFGGGDDEVTDSARIDLDFFGPKRTAAFDLAADVIDVLRGGPHTVGQIVIDRVTVQVGIRALPWDNANVRRMGVSITASARRTA